jgi:hypothetical protein
MRRIAVVLMAVASFVRGARADAQWAQPQPAPPTWRPQAPPPPAPPPAKPATDILDALKGGGAYVAGIGAYVGQTDVGVDGAPRAVGGGVHLQGLLVGHNRYFTNRARIGGTFGGGRVGAEGMSVIEGSFGVGLPTSDSSQAFLRLGIEAIGLKNDEIEATTIRTPEVQLGWHLWLNEVGFELGPRGALAARTEFEPGDEAQGRRRFRALSGAADVGGFATVVTSFLSLDASFARTITTAPLTIVEGTACVHYYVALCGFGQHWSSLATGPTGGGAQDARTIDVTSVGISLGVQASGSSTFNMTPFLPFMLL